jgi:hypothetical protein
MKTDHVFALKGESEGSLQCSQCLLVFRPDDGIRVFSDLDVRQPPMTKVEFPLVYVQLVSTDGDNITMTRGLTDAEALKFAGELIETVRRHQR